jgi:hypothetical protein
MALKIKRKKKSWASNVDETGRYANAKRRSYDDPEMLDSEDAEIMGERFDNDETDSENDLLDDDSSDFEDLDQEDDLMDNEGGEQVMDKHRDLLRQLTNFSPYLKEVVNGWLGLVWSEEDGKYVRQVGVEPIMNVNCASWCVSLLKTYTRENNIITDISKDNYNYIVADLIETVWINLGTRDVEFGLRNDGDIQRVAVEVQHAAELVLMGAGDGRYNKFLGATYTNMERGSRQEGRNSNQQTQEPIRRQGFISGFLNKFSKPKPNY